MRWTKTLPIVLILFCLQGYGQEITIYTIGDSTMSDKENPTDNPERGWAQVLSQYFVDEVHIENRAVNGRSTKSFINEGRWDSVVNNLNEGDFVFIQFGHNDQKIKDPKRFTNPFTAYRNNLVKFVNESRQNGAHPMLLSSIVRRNFNESGVLIDTHGVYPLVMRMVANDLEVPFIDLQLLTEQLEVSYGVESSKELHLHFKPGEHPYYPNGKEDNTHLSKKGATEIAKMVIDAIEKQQIALKKYIK